MPNMMAMESFCVTPATDWYNIFDWGNDKPNGASQRLAVALLSDATGNDLLTEAIYEEFERDIIAKLPDEWWLDDEEIIGWVVARQSKIKKLVAHLSRLKIRRLAERMSLLKAEAELIELLTDDPAAVPTPSNMP